MPTTSTPAAPAPAHLPGPPRSSWVPAFVSLAAIWGCSFLFMKVGLDQLPPVYITLARVAIGALTLLGVLVVTRTPMATGWRLWGHLFVVAALTNALPFTLFAMAEQRISSVIAGIWNATTPLTALMATVVVFPQERPTRARILGLLIGFAGVLTVLGVWRPLGATALTGHLMCFAAATCYGIGFPYIRRYLAGRAESGAALAAGQICAATLLMAVVAPLVAGAPPALASLHLNVVAAMLGLGALGTGIAFVLNYRVIRLAGAATAATVTYLVPLFATAAGALVLSEPITWYEPVGTLIVLAGVATAQGVWPRLLSRVRRPTAAAAPVTRS